MNEPGSIDGAEVAVVAVAVFVVIFLAVLLLMVHVVVPALERREVRKGRPFWADRPWSISVAEVHRPWGRRWQWAIYEELTHYPPIRHAHGTARTEEKARERAATARETVLWRRMLARQDEEALRDAPRTPWEAS